MARFDRVRALLRKIPGFRSAKTEKRALGTSVWDGGQVSRLTMDWVTIPLSTDKETRYDILRLRARARDVVRNHGFASRFLALLEQNVIGHKGITLDCDIQRGDAAHENMNDLVEAEWGLWGHAENCSVDGRLDWKAIQRMAIRTTAQDGEVLIRLIRGASNPWGFAIQLIDADLLDVTYNRTAGTENEIRMGVERDVFGKPLAYHCWKQHPQDYDFAPRENVRVRIPADEIIHLTYQRRVGETRSVTWFAPVLFNTQMLKGYFEAEVTAARVSAAKMGFITQANPEEGIGNLPDAAPNDGALTINAEPGSFDQLPPGMSITPWNPDHPNAGFDAFTGAVLREIASGLGISAVSVSNDLRAVNYSSIRTGMLAERDFYRTLQYWLIEHLHRRVFAEWIRMSILTGRLPSGARAALVEGAVTWQPRGWPWVDPLKDIEAKKLEIDYGLDSRTATLAEEGREPEDVFAELAAEKKLAAKHDIVIEGQLATPKTPPTDPTEADGGKPRAAVLAAFHGNGNGNGRHG